MSEKLNEKPKVTSIEEIRNQACREVALSGLEPGKTITVILRRASLLSLIQQGVIPNQLLPIAYKLLQSEGKFNPMTDSSPDEFKQFLEMLSAVCKAVMVEPSYDKVAEYLTDIQHFEIFFYAQRGLKALETFRRRQEPLIEVSSDGKRVRAKAK